MRNCIKKYSTGTVLAIAAVLLAGCLGSGSGGIAATPDTTAPTTTVAPAVNGTTDTATTLSVTIDENGAGYYLVLPVAAPVPTVADVLAGTQFAMTANVAATPALSGLISNTAYTVYFVAKDAAGNVQAAVQSVAVTTGYLVQGGLTWMPVTFTDTWANANTYCANTAINGQTGWRQPTQAELSALYASGAMNGQGWTLFSTWSSTPYSVGSHYFVNLSSGYFGEGLDWANSYVSCVRNVANVAPVANAGAAQNVTAGALVTLDGSASSDANVDPLSYSWSLTTVPGGGSTATLSGATTAAPTFTPDLAGTYIATLVVNDGTLDSAAATVTITVSPVYVTQGGLTWMPVTFADTWANANTYCTTTTINGQTGWRMPTQPELSALYTSGAMNGKGWTLTWTWSSTAYSTGHNYVYMGTGYVDWTWDANTMNVSCVR